jgi:AbrB family looped-hinge helix DNA binding protein
VVNLHARVGPGFCSTRSLYFLLQCKACLKITLSFNNQIVIPREARRALGLKPGDKLLVTVLGDRVVIIQKPKSHAKAFHGIARGLCPEDYLRKERDSWE